MYHGLWRVWRFDRDCSGGDVVGHHRRPIGKAITAERYSTLGELRVDETAFVDRTPLNFLCLVNNPDYQDHPFLAHALKKLDKDKLEKIIISLGWENVEYTNNLAERNNCFFRMLQKTRYKRRRRYTIKKPWKWICTPEC